MKLNLCGDELTPIERATLISKGKDVDRLPCNPNIANGVARIYGCKISEFNYSGKKIADAQISAYKKFKYDGVRIFTDLYVWAEAMGAKVDYLEDNTVNLLKPAIKKEDDIRNIKVFNPKKDGRMPIHLEAMKYLIEEVGSEVPCSAGIVGPFTNVSFLLETDLMLRYCVKRPDVIHELCELSLQSLMLYVDEIVKVGLTPTISEPMSSNSLISPKMFREFSKPYLKRLIDYIASKNKSSVLHICGETKGIWEDVANLGIGGFSIDNVANLEECKKTIGDKVKLMGNINPTDIMLNGSIDDVKKATLKSILQGYDSKNGYTVMSGCSLPIETPIVNIQTMMDTVRKVGYPIDKDCII